VREEGAVGPADGLAAVEVHPGQDILSLFQRESDAVAVVDALPPPSCEIRSGTAEVNMPWLWSGAQDGSWVEQRMDVEDGGDRLEQHVEEY